MEEHVHDENCTHDHVRGQTKDLVLVDTAADFNRPLSAEISLKEMRRKARNHRKAARNEARATAHSKYERRLVRSGATVAQLMRNRKNETTRSYGRRHIRRAAAKHMKRMQAALKNANREIRVPDAPK